MLEIIRRFSKGNGIIGESSYSGTGNGGMSEENVSPSGSNEVWTVACVDVTIVGEELWSVTGSTTGALPQYTTGGLYSETLVGFQIDAGGVDFILGDTFTVVGSSFTGTGDGVINNLNASPDAVTEVWTVVCTSAAVPGAEAWSVTGSVSGAQAAATTGVSYTNTFIDGFDIIAGSGNFAVSDQFTFDVTQAILAASSEGWTEERHIDDVLNGQSQPNIEMILKGPGLSGTEEIWAAFTSYQSISSDYYNISFGGTAGYVDSLILDDQPGHSGQRWMPCWNLGIRYWLAVNGQKITLITLIETHYFIAYVGKHLAFNSLGQFPYPITVMATDDTESTRYSAAGSNDLFNATSKARRISGLWESVYMAPLNDAYQIFGINSHGAHCPTLSMEDSRDVNGTYPLMPCTLIHPTDGALGDLDGVFYVTGFSAAAEDIITAEGTENIMISNNQATGLSDYIALRLE